MDSKIEKQLSEIYGWAEALFVPVSSGLINHTRKVTVGKQVFICQEMNTRVFTKPELIDQNLRMLADHLTQCYPDYLFTAPVAAVDGRTLVCLDNHYYRVFEWVNNSHTVDVLADAEEAFEAANQFGKFTALLEGFDAGKLGITLPHFHDLSLRYRQFMEAVQDGNESRKLESTEAIRFLTAQKGIVERYEKFIQNPESRQRVTHHDTKISNILFNNEQKGICVIDLDTVMPGFFLSDVGDMFRTYVCPVSEEEKALNLISVRKPFMEAIQKGYLNQMQDTLTGFELDHFFFSGEVLIYMQALRFLTDYLNNDVYYGSRYAGHNYVRAVNQVRLLEAFQEAV